MASDLTLRVGPVAVESTGPVPASPLTELDRLLDAGDEMTIVAGDSSVTLPRPQRVETETDGSPFRLADGRYGLELRWSVRDEE
ncbi:hypothetical protein [Haloprofundus halobius]|uniref:hypothetical protein n=1 Tax=Haloprofundus halobius TaxID=2876194 RepID=UPI001CCE7CAF|nr:hypothetical protein [Haloprofundus halobius]